MLRRSAAGLTALLLLAGVPASAPRAATQGSVGSTSAGQIALRAQLSSLIRITGLDDINLGTWAGGGGRSQTMNHRVCTNAPGQLFSVTATGSGPGGAFELANGAATLSYLLEYRAGPGGWTPLLPNVPLAGRRGQGAASGPTICPTSATPTCYTRGHTC